jgi:hypothetical protein
LGVLGMPGDLAHQANLVSHRFLDS